jgi:phenylpropionate dioxygenase-like ring-hydroxylating dioxygenase large terminal subunit
VLHALSSSLATRVEALRAAKTTDMADAVLRVPASDYTDSDVHQAELRRLFHGGPVLAGFSGAADGPGGWFTVDLCGRSVFIMRGHDGAVRGFRNACPHRGMQLLDGCGTSMRRITCPFHSWSFDSMGTNRAIPTREAFDQYSPDELDLAPVQVAEGGGLIYVSLDPEPIDITAVLGGVDAELIPLGSANQVLIDRRERWMDMNWKLGVDSYMESYHLHFLHKNTLRAFFFNDGSPFDAFGRNGRIAGIRRTFESAPQTPASVDGTPRPDRHRDALHHLTLEYQLFPNAVAIFQQDHFELSQVFPDPDNVHRALVVQSVYGPREGLDDAARARYQKSFELLLAVTIAEDFAACEKIQRTLRSGSPTHLHLGRNEPALIHLHQQLHEVLASPSSSETA